MVTKIVVNIDSPKLQTGIVKSIRIKNAIKMKLKFAEVLSEKLLLKVKI